MSAPHLLGIALTASFRQEGNTQVALPLLLSVAHTSAELQAWPAFRRATIMLAEALGTIDADLSLGTKSDGPDAIKMIHLAAKEVLGVWDQVRDFFVPSEELADSGWRAFGYRYYDPTTKSSSIQAPGF